MKELLKEIKENNLKNIYLFSGEEDYLIKFYESKLKNYLISPVTETMNYDVFEGKKVLVDDIINASLTLSFMVEKRFVVVKDSSLFTSGKKNETEKIAKFIENFPRDTIILFCEKDVDKRNKLYKKVSSLGRAIEFKTPNENDLVKWIQKLFKEENKSITFENTIKLLRTSSHNMNLIEGEVKKLVTYTKDSSEISFEDIENICSKTSESHIFNMINAVGNKNSAEALEIYNLLITMKESPIMVITMLARQFRNILICKLYAEKKASLSEISEKTSLRFFVVSECLKQGKNFTEEILKNAIKDCLNTDIRIKTGKINDKLAVELLILSYS